MADSRAFVAASQLLEEASDLDRLEARGTIRLLLKRAGLDAKSVTPRELQTVSEAWLAEELERRAVEGASRIVEQLGRVLSATVEPDSSESPEAVFERLGGSS